MPVAIVGILPWQRMESELRQVAGFGINLHCEITAVVQQLDAGKRGAEPDMEWPPVMGFVQSYRHAAEGMSQKSDGWNAGQHPAFPQNQ